MFIFTKPSLVKFNNQKQINLFKSMKKVKYGLLAFVMCATFAYKSAEKPTATKENTANSPKIEASLQKEQVFEGTFQGIEQGDYAYFKVKNAKEEKSLMVLNTDKTYEKIAANPKKFIGKKVKVYWVAAKQNIPEAGGMISIEKYIKAVLVN